MNDDMMYGPARYMPSPPDDALTQRVLAALCRHALIPDTSGWRLELAPGGSTDRTFSVVDSHGTARLTVRLARPGLGERLRYEERVLLELAAEQRGDAPRTREAAARRGESPTRPYPTDADAPSELPTRPCTPQSIARIEDDALPEGQMLVHEHIPGEVAALTSVSVEAREQLGACLAWVHRHPRPGYTIWPSLDVRPGTRAELFHDRLATLRRYRSAHGPLPEAATLIERLGRLDLPAGAGWHESGFALIHGDLSIGNILWNGDQVALIDWEFARDGDPAEDLAYLVGEQDLRPNLVAEMAECYVADGGDPWALARLPLWLPLVVLDAALWWADYRLGQGVDPSTVEEVTDRLRRAAALIR